MLTTAQMTSEAAIAKVIAAQTRPKILAPFEGFSSGIVNPPFHCVNRHLKFLGDVELQASAW